MMVVVVKEKIKICGLFLSWLCNVSVIPYTSPPANSSILTVWAVVMLSYFIAGFCVWLLLCPGI